MIDENKLAELRRFFNLRPAFSEVVWKGEEAKDILDTLEFLWKENAELKEDRELLDAYEILSMKQLETITKLEAMARAARK